MGSTNQGYKLFAKNEKESENSGQASHDNRMHRILANAAL